LLALTLVWGGLFARAAEVIPPPPPDHFNDYARVVRRETANQLNQELIQFERDTSNQILVAVYPRMQSNSSVEDYAVRVAQSWRVGQKERKNGAVLFAFQESHDLRIVTGYGLEGVLTDAVCKQIIENEIAPRFRAGDFDGGFTAGVRAMMAAARGEYRGSGRLAAEAGAKTPGVGSWIIPVAFFAFFILTALRSRSRRDVIYGGRGRRAVWWGNGPWGGGGFGGGGLGGGGWSGGGSSGGSFSGGGGSFGGGGAGGKW
jgi:uncharacterized protein